MRRRRLFLGLAPPIGPRECVEWTAVAKGLSLARRIYKGLSHEMAKKGALPKKEGSIKRSAAPKITAKGQGIVKKKHALVAGGKRALVQRLEAEAAASSKAGLSTKTKARKAKASNAVILGAVDGLKASLDELLAANAQVHRQRAEVELGGSLTSKRRQKIVAEETKHLQAVLAHPAFVADPFGALQEHLSNTMAAMEEKAKERGGGPSRSKR